MTFNEYGQGRQRWMRSKAFHVGIKKSESVHLRFILWSGKMLNVGQFDNCRAYFEGVRMFNRDNFMNVPEIAEEFNVTGEAVRRWIHKKYLDPSAVEVHGSAYYVKKEAVQLWKNALDGKQPMRGKRIPALAGFRGVHTEAEAEPDRPE